MKRTPFLLTGLLLAAAFIVSSCSKDDDENMTTPTVTGKNPDTADKIAVDRFSSSAGTLMVRDSVNNLPQPNQAVNYDMAPFITKGLGPSGQVVEYYNFDVQSNTPAPIFVLFRDGESDPVAGQLNIIDVIPGETGYNDFWQVNKVTVPAGYVANTTTSYSEIAGNGYTITPLDVIVNCPVVPEGSTATKRIGGGSSSTMRGWYKGKVVFYFSFEEKMLMAAAGQVPVSPIYVTFNINPDQPNGGPSSGFVTETGTDQTHNVVATIPSDGSYSPLWSVNIYDNMSFSSVSNLSSAMSAPLKASNAALVNCPVVSVQ